MIQWCIWRIKIRCLPGSVVHMGCHVERHHCSIGWLAHKLIRVHSMELVEVVVVMEVVVEHVGLVVVVECTCYVV